jgi:hypothetical protein
VLLEPEPFIDDIARLMEEGLGRMVGRRGEVLVEAVADMMLGSWMPPGLVAPYTESGGETDRLGAPPCSWIGEGIEVCKTGEWLLEDPDDMEVVRLRRLLPWLSWW